MAYFEWKAKKNSEEHVAKELSQCSLKGMDENLSLHFELAVNYKPER